MCIENTGSVTPVHSYAIMHLDIPWCFIAMVGWLNGFILTPWGRMTYICVSKLTILGSDNGLSPGRRQPIIWTYDGILLFGQLGTNFSEISIEIYRIQENAFDIVVWKMAAILSRPQSINAKMMPWYPRQATPGALEPGTQAVASQKAAPNTSFSEVAIWLVGWLNRLSTKCNSHRPTRALHLVWLSRLVSFIPHQLTHWQLAYMWVWPSLVQTIACLTITPTNGDLFHWIKGK